MNPITPEELCAMTDREGLILHGGGGDLNAFYIAIEQRLGIFDVLLR